jgi:hypothetical protein
MRFYQALRLILASKSANFPQNGQFSSKNGQFSPENGDFSAQNGEFSPESGDFGDFSVKSGCVAVWQAALAADPWQVLAERRERGEITGKWAGFR